MGNKNSNDGYSAIKLITDDTFETQNDQQSKEPQTKQCNIQTDKNVKLQNVQSIKSNNTQNQPQEKVISSQDILKQLVANIKKAKTKEEIVILFNSYQPEIVIDFYQTNSICAMFKNDDQKSKILASLLPKNDKNLIKKYFENLIPYHILLLMGENLNYNTVRLLVKIGMVKFHDSETKKSVWVDSTSKNLRSIMISFHPDTNKSISLILP